MQINEVINVFTGDEKTGQLLNHLETIAEGSIHLKGLIGSSVALLASKIYEDLENNHVFILPAKESAAYFLNDLESIFDEKGENFHKKKILFFFLNI